MIYKKLPLTIFLVLFFGLIFQLDKKFKYPFKSVDISEKENILPVEKYLILDLTGILFGVRRLAADIAWIQVLQYYGSPEEECTEEHKGKCHHGIDYGRGKYYDLLKLCQRVIRLDPYFQFAYLYGSASLTWNLDRPDEGIQLLDEGIKRYPVNKPDYWQLHLYKLAIVYKKLDKYKKMIFTLEKAIKQPNCPLMVKVILANIYKRAGEYRRALEIWIEIYNYGMSEYFKIAEMQIEELQKKLQ